MKVVAVVAVVVVVVAQPLDWARKEYFFTRSE